MSIAGLGVVAIWHDLVPDVKPEFYQWHNREHMPERLGIPGFNRGRRFIALAGTPEYFNLYEGDTVAVMGGAEYMHRLNHPTPWTQRVVPGFRNVSRSVCAVELSLGVGQGGVMLTLRFDAEPGSEDRLSSLLRHDRLPRLADAPGVSGVHFCRADEATSRAETAEKKARGSATLVPNWIVLVEGVNRAFVEAARSALLDDAALVAGGATPAIAAGTYLLEHARDRRA